jgi:hypothetical protein
MGKDKSSIKKRIEEEEDYIYCPRLGNSLSTLIDKNPDGVDDERIMKVLLMDEDELQEVYDSALNKLRKTLNIDE